MHFNFDIVYVSYRTFIDYTRHTKPTTFATDKKTHGRPIDRRSINQRMLVSLFTFVTSTDRVTKVFAVIVHKNITEAGKLSNSIVYNNYMLKTAFTLTGDEC